MNNNNKAFTLVEILVAITLFMIVMVSVMQIFWISSDLTNKVDINRQVQSNIKVFMETLSEDIKKNWVWWVKNEIPDWYTNNSLDKWVILQIWQNKYFLSNDEINYSLLSKNDIENTCKENINWAWININLKNNCFVAKQFPDGSVSKLTNSWIAFENIEYSILWEDHKKLVINFFIRPSSKKWISPKLINKSKIIFQTTISERYIEVN